MMTRPWIAALALSLCLLPAQGSSVRPLTLGELCAHAATIQRVRVRSATSSWGVHLGQRAIVTTLELDVLELVAGAPVPRLQVFGGQVGPERMVLSGQPELAPGEELLLFLHGAPTYCPYLGLWQGVFRLSPAGASSAGRSVLDVSRLGQLHWVRDNEPPLPVSDFLAEVRRLRAEVDARRAEWEAAGVELEPGEAGRLEKPLESQPLESQPLDKAHPLEKGEPR